MKNFIAILSIFAFVFISCNTDDNTPKDEPITVETPKPIEEYVNSYFPEHQIVSVVKEKYRDKMTYKASLTNSVYLRFNKNIEIQAVESSEELPPTVVPNPVLEFIKRNFPNNYIKEWEVKETHQDVELDNGVELEFTLEGEFIRMDNNSSNNEVTESNLPSEISTYITTHFSGATVVSADKDDDDDNDPYDDYYEIHLSNGVKLSFNKSLKIIEIDGKIKLPDSVIPGTVLTYVQSNYPNNFIISWELEKNNQEVELNSGLKLKFKHSGEFLGVDDDNDNDNEQNIDVNNLPAKIKEFLNTHFPQNTVVAAKKESDNGVDKYEIKLNNNIELTFSAGFDIIEIDGDVKLPNSVIQPKILTYVQTNYPNNYIVAWELKHNYQEIELNNGLELKFKLNGDFMGTDNDDDNNNDGDENISVNNLPEEIKSYINTHFPQNTAVSAEKENDNGVITYDVKLNNGIELTFNSGFNIIEIDGEVKLPDSVIATSILNYVQSNYPNNYIVAWELKNTYQKIELNNGLELMFKLNGEFMGGDNDNDNDENISVNNLPAKIKSYIDTHFPQNTVVSAEKDNDNGVITYEIQLNNAVELTFNSGFDIIEIDGEVKLPDTVIPAAILTYVQANYASNHIVSWELKNTYQEVELNNGVELKFKLNGEFIGVGN